MDGRDRDPATGRARNARPRDALGRPLPRDAEGVGRVPDDLILPPAPALAEAQRLLDAGMPFHAHEILEGTWKTAAPAERDLWQGLAQLAVGLTHVLRGNRRGACTLLDRGIRRLAAYSSTSPHDIDVDGVRRWAERLSAELVSDRPMAEVDTAPPTLRRPAPVTDQLATRPPSSPDDDL